MWYVYVIESLKSGIRYVGITQDLICRVREHNAGKSKFTSGHLPWKLIHQETVSDRIEARKREKKLKTYRGREYLKRLIEKQK